MIKLKKEEHKKWAIMNDDNVLVELDLISSSITNKYFIISSFIEKISETCKDDFDDWFCSFITDYNKNKDKRYDILIDNIPMIKHFVNEYITNKADIDFSQFVDESKAKKNSILFTVEEIKQIALISGYLKFYAIFFNSSNLKLNQRLHRKAYNEIIKDISDTEIIFKIFNVIKTKTFKYNLSDRYMWEYIKMIQCKTIDVHVVEIFNFIMNNILVLCQEDKNPITYFVGVIDESVKWFLRSVYKGSIIYDDSISTEDIHGINVNNLKTYSFNDTIGRLKGIAYEEIYKEIERKSETKMTSTADRNEGIITFQNRISGIKYISPLSECLAYPMLSKITNIPYNHFKTLTPEHSAILSVYIQRLLRKVFKSEFKTLFSILLYYPTTQPAVITTYKIKSINYYINIQNDINNFFGFKTKMPQYEIFRYFIGRVSRISFTNIITGQELSGVPLSKIEKEMIMFYTNFFANKYDKQIEEMKKLMNSSF